MLSVIAEKSTQYRRALKIVKDGIFASIYEESPSDDIPFLVRKTYYMSSKLKEAQDEILREKARKWEDFELFLDNPEDGMVRTYQLLAPQTKKRVIARVRRGRQSMISLFPSLRPSVPPSHPSSVPPRRDDRPKARDPSSVR